jgi:LacI family transcriptional regulator
MNTRELARLLGLSHTTVSLALGNHPRISDATKRRVIAAAKKSGYRPNALVSALMTRIRQGKPVPTRGEVLAFLTAYPKENDWRKLPSTWEGFAGARRQAEKLGYRIEHFWLGAQATRARHVSRVLDARAVRGAFVISLPADAPLVLDWAARPVVAIGYSFQERRIHQAAHNHVEGVFSCYRELRARGYRRIGLALVRYDDEQVRHYWRAGYLAARQVHGGATLPIHLHPGYHEDDNFLGWVEKRRPDAIIGSFPNLALDLLRRHGTAVPEKIAYASLDLDTRHVGEIAGVRQDWEKMGAALVDLLVGQINANERGLPETPKLVQIEGVWVPGKTALHVGATTSPDTVGA